MAGNYGKHVNRNTGGNTARVSTIPKLEQQQVVNQYESAQPRYNRSVSPIQNLVNYAENMKTRQALANDYNEVKNQQTADTLARLGQTDTARGSNSFAVEQAKQGRLMSGLVNSLADNEKFGNLTTFLAGAAPGYGEFRRQQNEAMKGTLTNEMKSAGLTQEDIDRWNRQQNQIEREQVLSNYAKEHPVLSTLNAFPENIAGSTEGNIEKVLNYLTGKPLESKPTNAEIYRQTVSEGINSKPGNFAYNVGNSIGDMLLAQLVTGGLFKGKAAAGLMGLEKSNPVMNSAIERGLTPGQILGEGVGSGLTTALTEAIPFGRFAEGGHILGSMAAEGLQEGAEDLADTALDEIITRLGGNNEKSEYNRDIQAYIDAGYSEEDAKKAAQLAYLKQLGLDVAAGAVSGGAMQGGMNILNQRNFVTGKEKIPSLTNEQLNAIPEVDENGNPVKSEEEVKKAEAENKAIMQYLNVLKENVKNDPNGYDSWIEAASQVRNQRPELDRQIRDQYVDLRSYLDDAEAREAKAREEYERRNDSETLDFLRNIASDISNESQNWETREEQINRIESEVANEVAAEKEKVIADLENQNPTAGEAVYNFEKYINNLIQQNPEMEGYLTAELNDVQDMAEGWVTDFDRYRQNQPTEYSDNVFDSKEEAQGYLNSLSAENNIAQIIERTKNAVLNSLDTNDPYAGEKVSDFLARMKYIAKVNPSMREAVNTAINEVNARSEGWRTKYPTQPFPKVERQSRSAEDIVRRSRELKAIEQRVGDFLVKMAENTATSEDAEAMADSVTEMVQNLTQAQQMEVASAVQEAENAYHDFYMNAGLDEDVKNIATVEEGVEALENEVKGLPINLKFFGRRFRKNVEANDSGRVQTGRYKTSQTYTNTAEKSGNLTPEQRATVEANKSMLYQENSEKESVAEAEKRIINGGWDTEFDKLINKESFNNVDTDELMMIWRHYKEQAMSLDERGLDSTDAWQKTVDCLTKIKAEGSREGAALQALAKWSRSNTPEGLLAQAESIIAAAENGYAKNFEKTKDGWYKQINELTKGKTRQMDVGFIKDFLTEAERLEGLDIDSREAKHIMANLGKLVNSQIPVTLKEKITTFLMDNMLGNFRTLITRNAGGNLGYNLVEQTARKRLSAAIDKQIAKKTGVRTISGNTKEGRSAYFEGAKEAIKQEIYDFQNNIRSARSGENTLNTAVTNNRQIYNDKFLGKIGNIYDKLVKAGLSAGDRPFFESVYSQYMTEYEQLYKDGKMADMPRETFDKLAKANAYIKALEAVYQDDSAMAEAFIGLKNSVNKLSEGVVGADLLSQFTMPFVKTPANIIQRAIEYSPIGLIKNAIQTTRELKHAMNGNEFLDFDQERFATETARNLIGSALFTIAIMLAKAGKMTGAYSEDKDMAQAQREAGMQEYALHNPFGLNMDVDISSVPVLGNDMVAAAAAYDAFRNNPELSVGERVSKGLTAGLQSQFESSALQGMQRLFGGSFNSGGDLLSNATDTLKSGGTQLIPSLARQAAQFADPYRRQLTGANENDYYRNSMLNSIPGLRQGLEPRISRTGEYMEQNPGRGTVAKFFDTFINPFNVSVGTEDAVRDEAMRLFEATGNNIAFQPGVTIKDLKTEDHIPTAEEFTQYQQNAYGAMNQIASQVIASDYYQTLTDGDKEALLDSIYKAVKSVEKANILGTDKSNLSGAAKAYDEGGAEGMMDYFTAKETLDSMGATNNPQNRELVTEAMNNGTFDEMEQLGFDVNLIKRYNHAADRIPSLNPTTFQQQFNAIDTSIDGTGNNSITQKEIIAYLNQNPTGYNEEEALRIWDAYLQSYGKIPVFNPDSGTWSAK